MGLNIKVDFALSLTAVILVLSFQTLQADDAVVLRLKADLDFLCSPELSGRDVPGETGDKTAEWIANRFDQLDIEPLFTDGSYLQEVPLISGIVDTQNTVFMINNKPLKWGNDYYVFPRKLDSLDVELSAAWCSYGLQTAELGRADFEEANGKAALVMSGSGDVPRDLAGRHALTPFKAASAERAGVKMLLVNYSSSSPTDWPPGEIANKISDLDRLIIDLPESKSDIPVIYLNASSVLPILMIRQDSEPQNLDQVKVRLVLKFTRLESHHGFNVAGMIRNTRPGYVVLGAHYDHLGTDPETGYYYPGADDNASGIAGLLEICRELTENRSKDARSIIFTAFTAEEDGLLGSMWFVNNFPIQKTEIFAMINMDMIGRRGSGNMRELNSDDTGDSLYVGLFFSGAAPGLRNVSRSAADLSDLNAEINPVNSFAHFGDAASFHDVQIPTIHIFSGFHRDYHSLHDTVDRLDFNKMGKIVSLSSQLVTNLSEEAGDLPFDPSIQVKGYIPH